MPLDAGDRQLGAFRQADVEIGRVQRHRNAERLQPLDDVVAGGLLVGGARLAHQRHEPIEQRARFVEPDRLSRGSLRVASVSEEVEHVSLPSVRRFNSIEEDPQVLGRRRRRRAADEDERERAQRHADFDRVDAVRREAALQVNVHTRHPTNPATMLQIAPSFVPRRQFKPSTTGTKKKLAMNFACSTTIAWTSASLRDANQNGTSPRTTIDRRFTQTSAALRGLAG